MSLAGIERHSKQHLQSKKAANSFCTPTNCLFFVGSLMVLSASSIVIISSAVSSVSAVLSSSTAHPTSIPWINNASDCTHTGRTWVNDRCWDNEHSPSF